MRIGLIPNPDKDTGLTKTGQVAEEILSLGGSVVMDAKYQKYFKAGNTGIEFEKYSKCDMLICLGGDGTFLTAVQQHLSLDTPIIGVNMGSVGFLSEINPDETLSALRKIFKGEFKTEKRMLLKSTCYSKDGVIKQENLSLNDVVITRGGISRILNVDLFIDGVLVEKLPGDGVIISTPTGSTAYSLSAGGPIIQPDLEVILITPLNPHTLHNRCYIVSPDTQVEVVIKEYPFNPFLTSDGVQVCTLEQSDRVHITKADISMNLVRLSANNFYESLTSKIYNR
jgi:NAD+ kinase